MQVIGSREDWRQVVCLVAAQLRRPPRLPGLGPRRAPRPGHRPGRRADVGIVARRRTRRSPARHCSPRRATTSAWPTSGAACRRTAWTAPDWSTSASARWAWSSPVTPTTSRRPRRRSGRRVRRATCCSSPATASPPTTSASRPGTAGMLHAPETGAVIVEEPLTPRTPGVAQWRPGGSPRGRRPAVTARIPAPLLVLGAVVSVQFGGALAATLVPRIGAAGSVALRLVLAAAVLLAVARPAAAPSQPGGLDHRLGVRRGPRPDEPVLLRLARPAADRRRGDGRVHRPPRPGHRAVTPAARPRRRGRRRRSASCWSPAR